ncbi:MAG: AAA family ATPase [Planctomycetes bacterium]|nr:AAA family ATPase [Planctomycetota bacterium]
MDLLGHRLLFVTGKGGVGKSTVAAALALAAARRGLRTLLVEMDTRSMLAEVFGTGAVGAVPVELRAGVEAVDLEPDHVAEDFLRTHLRFERVWRPILESRVWHTFYEAAPGLKELLCLGKVYRLEEEVRRYSRVRRWDLLVVDAPATGHAMGLLNVSRVASRILVGPLRRFAQRITDLVTDPERTAACIVTLAEEMPVNETLELHGRLTGKLGLKVACVILNALVRPALEGEARDRFETLRQGDVLRRGLEGALGGGPATALLDCTEAQLAREALQARYARRLRRRLRVPSVEVPWLAVPEWDLRAVEEVSHLLERGLGRVR